MGNRIKTYLGALALIFTAPVSAHAEPPKLSEVLFECGQVVRSELDLGYGAPSSDWFPDHVNSSTTTVLKSSVRIPTQTGAEIHADFICKVRNDGGKARVFHFYLTLPNGKQVEIVG